MTNQPKILITGAGGAAAISFYKSLENHYDVFMADMDQQAAGLYMVEASNRLILPAGQSSSFIEKLLLLCEKHEIDILVPTVDWELLPIAENIKMFHCKGIQVVISEAESLSYCLDKWCLMEKLSDQCELAVYQKFDQSFDRYNWAYPALVKPRRESGSRGIKLINNPIELQGVKCDGSQLIQEFLPGKEFSVDVYRDQNGQVLASVVRERMKIDSGIAVVSRTVKDDRLSDMAEQMANHLNLSYAVNIQFKLDRNDQPRLLEINPRYPGTMPLTVAAGVNMPQMAIDELLGVPLKQRFEVKSLAMVRSWQENFIEPQMMGL